jgi:hypothetical protein
LKEYGIIHFDSPDKRIDVALLYQKKKFQYQLQQYSLIHLQKKQVAQLKLKDPIPKKNR